jgi:hypothetical protein
MVTRPAPIVVQGFFLSVLDTIVVFVVLPGACRVDHSTPEDMRCDPKIFAW